FVRVYRFVLKEDELNEAKLKHKAIFTIVIVECILVSYTYFESNGENISNIVNYLEVEDYIGNQTYAVADYIQTIDEDFYRIISRYETQYNEPIFRGYNGFSVANGSAYYKKDMSWLLANNYDEGVRVSSNDYMITSALSAKYYFTPDYETALPGYEYYDRIEDITIYKNTYFIPVGSRQKYYILDTEFDALSREQKQYLFLNCLILDADQVADLSTKIKLEAYDLSLLPKNPSELNYYQAVNYRQSNSVRQVEYSENYVHSNITVIEPALITFSIPYDKGWKAYGNGEQLPVYEVNNGFVAVLLPTPGTYNLSLEYKSPGFEIGFSITSVTLISILACFYKYHEDKKKKPIVILPNN
ncbi:MAG: YfhO family protein, partial [Turicibacter sp.]